MFVPILMLEWIKWRTNILKQLSEFHSNALSLDDFIETA